MHGQIRYSPVPVGIFDSGVGGLSVLHAIRQRIPAQPLIYFADQVHVPYGLRPLAQVRFFAEAITRFLLDQGAGMIVVACNAASAAALRYLRGVFPGTPFVGMEPAVKPAAEFTRSGVVGVLATPATFQGELYASVVERFGSKVELLQDTCPGLVAEIEAGHLEGGATRQILELALRPMLARKIDTVVLGCTHYPFVIPEIQQIVGSSVRVIDPAPAIARQAERLLSEVDWLAPGASPAEMRFITSGQAAQLEQHLPKLLGIYAPVDTVCWKDAQIEIKPSAA